MAPPAAPPAAIFKVKVVVYADSSSTDTKTTIITIRAIQLEGNNDWALIPRDKSILSLHPDLAPINAIKRAKKALQGQRYERRIVAVTLNALQYEKYFDEEGNAVFQEESLESVDFLPPKRFDVKQIAPIIDSEAKDQTTKQQSAPISETKPLQTIVKDIVIPKFSSKTTNARNWITLFERECARIKVPANRYHEALRLFLEGSAENWYSATRITSMAEDWTFWRNSFNEAFENKGWSDVMYAYSYSYIYGTVSEYALKKLNLIVEVDALTSENVKIYLIVHGLPQWARSKLDRNEITSIGKLLQKLNQIENPTIKRNNSNNNTNNNSNNSNNRNTNNPRWSNTATEPCPYCLKKGFRRFHLESECRVKARDEDRRKNNSNNKFDEKRERPFKVNTTELNYQILENEQKNE